MLGGLKSGVFIAGAAEADWFMLLIRDSAAHIQTCVTGQDGDPAALVQRLMLDPAAPTLFQDWTWASRSAWPGRGSWPPPRPGYLLHLHPDSGGLHLTPSSQLAHPCNITSAKDGLIWAETFAAADPRDSRIMDMNVARIAGRLECHRYGFFMSPLFPGVERRSAFEHSGVQVWSVDV
jgi:hypothetical protein